MKTVRRAFGAQDFRDYTGPVPAPITEAEALRRGKIPDDYSLGLWDVGLVHMNGAVDWMSVWIIAAEEYVEDVNAGCLGGDLCPKKKRPGWMRYTDMFDARTGKFVIGGNL